MAELYDQFTYGCGIKIYIIGLRTCIVFILVVLFCFRLKATPALCFITCLLPIGNWYYSPLTLDHSFFQQLTEALEVCKLCGGKRLVVFVFRLQKQHCFVLRIFGKNSGD